MDNRQLGIILVIACVALAGLVFSFNAELKESADASCSCSAMNDLGFCPHAKQTNWQTYIGIALISGMLALAAYLLFFEKSQKEIVSALNKQKHIQVKEEKFSILLRGMDPEEIKVMKAVKEQDGITQQTLRLRTDLHKSKLSIVLDRLEKKNLIKRTTKGKTKQVHLKIKV